MAMVVTLTLGETCQLSAHSSLKLLWIYPQQLDDAWHGFFGYQDPLTLGGIKRPPSIWLWQRTRIHYGFGDGSRWYSTNSSLVLKERDWNHVATTFDGSSYKLYVNGNEVHSYLGASNQTPFPCR